MYEAISCDDTTQWVQGYVTTSCKIRIYCPAQSMRQSTDGCIQQRMILSSLVVATNLRNRVRLRKKPLFQKQPAAQPYILTLYPHKPNYETG